jgi:hypothetical protein
MSKKRKKSHKRGYVEDILNGVVHDNGRHDDQAPSEERVDHPAHYGGADDPYETIKVLQHWLTPEEFRGFCLGNLLKYVSDLMTDLRKARWYLDYFITHHDNLLDQGRQDCS